MLRFMDISCLWFVFNCHFVYLLNIILQVFFFLYLMKLLASTVKQAIHCVSDRAAVKKGNRDNLGIIPYLF